jgi:histidinol phosphatase-like PHP family hydrolase
MIADNGVAVLLSDDAHEAKNIGRHFDEAGQLIKDLNLKSFTR